MNEKDVAFFGTLLNLDTETVNSAVEDGTLGEKITALGLMKKSDVDTLKENLKREVRSQHLAELEEAAKKGELPQEIYKPINGAVLEKLEKKLSKEYDVNDYEGIDDLVAKAIKNTAKPDDTKLQELLSKVTALQTANEKLVSEKDEIKTQLTKEKNDWILGREKTDAINQVPFDFSDVDENELESVEQQRKEILKSVFDAQYTLGFKDEKITIFDKNGNPKLNEATMEPVPLSDVLIKTATTLGQKLKSPESGGQGGSSSGKKNSQFQNVDDYVAYCESKGIQPSSPEGMALAAKSGLKFINNG
jgi:molybdopterin converting factor small subunit